MQEHREMILSELTTLFITIWNSNMSIFCIPGKTMFENKTVTYTIINKSFIPVTDTV